MHRQAPKVQSDCTETEKDSRIWEDKGREIIAWDSKASHIKWLHNDCVGMSASTVLQGKRLCPTCHSSKHKTKVTKNI